MFDFTGLKQLFCFHNFEYILLLNNMRCSKCMKWGEATYEEFEKYRKDFLKKELEIK